MAPPFITPEQAATKAYDAFVKQYKTQIAAELKKNYDVKKMTLVGFPEKPTDKDFEKWAGELITSTSRKMTYKKNPADPAEKPQEITLQMIQETLSAEAKAELMRKFRTDDLNEIILKDDQLRAAGQQISKATHNHRGTMSFLGGATIMDAIMGFLEWAFSGFPRGKDGNIFSGLKESIARRATDGMAADAESLLAANVPSIAPGMREFIGKEFKAGAQAETGLAPKAPVVALGDIKVGQDVKAQASTPGLTAIKLAGKPSEDLPKLFEGIVRQAIPDSVVETMGKAYPKLKAAFDDAKPKFIKVGTKLAMDPAWQKKSPEEFAQGVLDETKKRLKNTAETSGISADDARMQALMNELRQGIAAQKDVLVKAAKGESVTLAPQPAASSAKLIMAQVETSLAKTLDPAKIRGEIDAKIKTEVKKSRLGSLLGGDNVLTRNVGALPSKDARAKLTTFLTEDKKTDGSKGRTLKEIVKANLEAKVKAGKKFDKQDIDDVVKESMKEFRGEFAIATHGPLKAWAKHQEGILSMIEEELATEITAAAPDIDKALKADEAAKIRVAALDLNRPGTTQGTDRDVNRALPKLQTQTQVQTART